MFLEPGNEVEVHGIAGVWQGRIIRHHINYDGKPNGISRVEVIDPGSSQHRPGDVVDVGTLTLRSAS